jgi:hypothetical protein
VVGPFTLLASSQLTRFSVSFTHAFRKYSTSVACLFEASVTFIHLGRQMVEITSKGPRLATITFTPRVSGSGLCDYALVLQTCLMLSCGEGVFWQLKKPDDEATCGRRFFIQAGVCILWNNQWCLMEPWALHKLHASRSLSTSSLRPSIFFPGSRFQHLSRPLTLIPIL